MRVLAAGRQADRLSIKSILMLLLANQNSRVAGSRLALSLSRAFSQSAGFAFGRQLRLGVAGALASGSRGRRKHSCWLVRRRRRRRRRRRWSSARNGQHLDRRATRQAKTIKSSTAGCLSWRRLAFRRRPDGVVLTVKTKTGESRAATNTHRKTTTTRLAAPPTGWLAGWLDGRR